jgi:hypothetical protein
MERRRFPGLQDVHMVCALAAVGCSGASTLDWSGAVADAGAPGDARVTDARPTDFTDAASPGKGQPDAQSDSGKAPDVGHDGAVSSRDAATTVDATMSGGVAGLPPTGQAWLLIGQDVGSIVSYANQVRLPGGVVGYTALDTLVGVTSSANWGAGDQSLTQLAGEYPGQPVAVGLYLVGMLGSVVSGGLDSQIDSLAGTLASYGRPVLLRIGYEFDNPINGYDPSQYQAAFSHIVNRVRAAGPSLVRSVWQSEAACQAPGQGIDAWYPGDAYVDWVGLSYFTQYAACNNSSVNAVVGFAQAHSKPLFIAESTPQGYDLSALNFSSNGNQFQGVSANDIWSRWFQPYFAFIHANQNVIRAVAYIDADWNAQPVWQVRSNNGYWGDSRVQQNAQIKQMWTSELQGASWVQP